MTTHHASRVVVGLALLSALATRSISQGVTTAELQGYVQDANGHPAKGAAVTVTHEPSSTRVTVLTRDNGQYDVPGLRVGGPYTITVSAGKGSPLERHNVYTTVANVTEVDFVSAAAIALPQYTVFEDVDDPFNSGVTSTGSSYSARSIAIIPTVRRDVQDIANLDPRVSLVPNTATGEFSISVQGQNSRYNSFLIDGLQANDPFGLNANGFATLKSPIPLDAIADYSIDLDPYDVTRSSFTGALVNVVTKSGTNTFHGSLYGYYTGTRLRAEDPGKSDIDPAKGQHEPLRDRTFGFTFGGPIVRDRLFFFAAYDDFKHTAPPTSGQVFVPNSDDLAAVITAAKGFGYDAGTADPSTLESAEQKTYLAKLDWNISDDQRATFTYRRVDGSAPVYADFSGSTATSLSNHWYLGNRISDNFSAQLNSTWDSDFQTDAGIAYSKYNGTNTPTGKPFPEVYVNGIRGTRLDTGSTIATGQIDLGTNVSYQLNELNTKDLNGHVYGEYELGDHSIKFGGDADHTQYYNAFVQYYYGRYAFANPKDFASGAANYLRYQQAAPGFSLSDNFASYSLTNLGALLQDTWKPSPHLVITGGLRLDYPYIPQRPPYLATFESTFGFRNDHTGSGNVTLAPRLAFSYDLPLQRKTQIRGGIGLFQGTNPAVWVADAFDTFGGLNAVTLPAANSQATSSVSPTAPIPFNPDAHYVQTLPAPGTPAAIVNTIDPNFRTPVMWKGNLAFDHTLPWLGLIATLEIDATKVESDIYLQSLNLKAIGTNPDGRIRYGGNLHPNFSSVINMTNTHKGDSQQYTAMLQRPLKDHWAVSLAYTRSHATEVQPLTSSIATSSFSNRATINPNENVARRSYYLTPDKWIATATREFNFFRGSNAATRISAIFRAQIGHTFSWVFLGDANGDGIQGNDAFYVPSGPSDPKVTWTNPAQRDAFFAYVQTTDLKKYMGRIVPPNSSNNPWQQTLDLHVEQDLPIHSRAKLTLFADCLNFANLFNKHWGVDEGIDFQTAYTGYNRPIAAATVNANGQYVYTFSSSTLAGQPVFTDLSRWQLQIGAKLSF